MTVLIVDDDAMNLKLLGALLEEEGYSILTANDGLEALAVLEREPIDAVISDIHMPNMDGYRFCYEVRVSSRFYSLPFIVYTASYTASGDEELSLSLGADKFLRKPVSPKVIAEALREVLKGERRHHHPIESPQGLSLMKEYNARLVAKLEEKNAELQAQSETLRQSASHKQAILDSALDSIVAMGSNGRIVEFNRAAERTFGFTRSEALGAAVDSLIPPSLRERYRRGLTHYLASGEGPALGKRLELTGLRKNGAEFPIELTITRIAGTEPPMFTGFVRDLTEQKRQQEAQLAAEAKFRRLVEQSITGIYVIQDDKFAYVNPKMVEIFGWTQQELTCKPLVDFIFEEDRQLVCENIRKRLAGTIESIHYTLRAVRKDGTLIHVEAHGGLTEYNGRPGILGSLLDVTERKQAEEQVRVMHEQLEQNNRELMRRNQEIRYFYQTLSHELKTPLTSAREFVSIVMDGLAGELNQTQSTYLGIAKESCTQLALYINDLLDATRLETGKLHVELKPTSLTTVIQRAMATIKLAAAQKQIRLNEDLDGTLIDVMVDESRIMQIIANLLNNALKFTPEGGAIAVTLSQDPRDPERVQISVADTGCGIAKDQLKRIFDRLYQVNGSDAAAHGGIGLGLYLCRELILLHGGNIWVESEIGTGSTFTFDVPKRAVTKGPHVLIVDDDYAIRESLRLVLEEKHFDVTTAEGGNQALELMGQDVPDIVVLDLLMAGLNGPSTLKEIRKKWGLIPVILYTGYPDGDLLVQAMESSPFTMLAKPCPLKLFVSTVRRLCPTHDTEFLKKTKVSIPAQARCAGTPVPERRHSTNPLTRIKS
jgi:PAS domain S-box-containing protein